MKTQCWNAIPKHMLKTHNYNTRLKKKQKTVLNDNIKNTFFNIQSKHTIKTRDLNTTFKHNIQTQY